MPRRPSVPVVVLSGGLGSGKTSLLNHLLRQRTARIGVVVNDFGDVNVDAFLVRGHVDASATITGGCLCCLADPSELDATLATLSSPELDLDAILVEASGLAEPRELARMLLARVSPWTRFGGIVEVLDATVWREDGTSLPVAVDHLEVASLLVVNKTDTLEGYPDAAARLDAAIATHAPSTPVVRTTFGAVDTGLLFDVADRPAPTGQLSFGDLVHELAAEGETSPQAGAEASHGEAHAHAHAHGEECAAGHCSHPHHAWTSVSVDSPLPTSPRALVAFLETRAAGVHRVKGHTWVDVPGGRRGYVVQAVGGWLAFEPASWGGDEEPVTQLVAIGTGMDDAAVEAALRGCLAEPGSIPADHLHALTRYLR